MMNGKGRHSSFIIQPSSFLNGFSAAFAGADSDAVFEGENEDFSVADFAGGSGASALNDGVDSGFEKGLVDGDHQLDLSEEVDGDFMAAIGFGLPSLSAESLDVHDGEAEDLDIGQRLFDGFEAMGLDDGDNEFHGSVGGCIVALSWSAASRMRFGVVVVHGLRTDCVVASNHPTIFFRGSRGQFSMNG
jgi:hypothetical protein